jgi:DNA (cytosine-5)-methyltransferase 1
VSDPRGKGINLSGRSADGMTGKCSIQPGDRMTVGSLFSGIGGFDLGLERAGMTVRWQVERDPWCQKVLAKHWPDVPRYENVEDVGGELECVDLICGGFPCQPVSVAGQRQGTDDDRWLWPEFRRIVGLLGPRYVLVENVPGLFTANGGHAFGEVIGDLADLGYDCEWTVLSAADVGAPHLRKRVWIVAHAKRGRCGTNGERRSVGKVEDRKKHDKRSSQESDSLANAESNRRRPGRPRGSHPRRQGKPEYALQTVADAEGDRHPEIAKSARGAGVVGSREDAAYPTGQFSDGSDDNRGGRPRPLPESGNGGEEARPLSSQWPVEPDVGRVAHGVPLRVDRLKGLGNAIVPQCAEWIGRQLLTFG